GTEGPPFAISFVASFLPLISGASGRLATAATLAAAVPAGRGLGGAGRGGPGQRGVSFRTARAQGAGRGWGVPPRARPGGGGGRPAPPGDEDNGGGHRQHQRDRGG